MNYLDPFLLLDAKASTPLEDAVLRKTRQRWLAEFQLNGNLPLSIGDKEWSRDEVLSALEQLRDPEKMQLHALLREDSGLQIFLNEHRAPSWVLTPKAHYQDQGFLGFLEPWFISIYRTALLQAVKAQDLRQIRHLNNLLKTFAPLTSARLYGPANNHLLSQKEQLQELKNSLPHDLEKAEWEKLMSTKFLKVLNALPIFFQPVRGAWAEVMAEAAMRIFESERPNNFGRRLLFRAEKLDMPEGSKFKVESIHFKSGKLWAISPLKRQASWNLLWAVLMIGILLFGFYGSETTTGSAIPPQYLELKQKIRNPDLLFELLSPQIKQIAATPPHWDFPIPEVKHPYQGLFDPFTLSGPDKSQLSVNNQSNWDVVLFLSDYNADFEVPNWIKGGLERGDFKLVMSKMVPAKTSFDMHGIPPGVYKASAYWGKDWNSDSVLIWPHAWKEIPGTEDAELKGFFNVFGGIADNNELMSFFIRVVEKKDSTFIAPSFKLSLSGDAPLKLRVEEMEVEEYYWPPR